MVHYGNGTYGCYTAVCAREMMMLLSLKRMHPVNGILHMRHQLNNLSNIIQLIDGKENKADLVNKHAIARILKVWAVSNLTDTYGDVPYSESCLPKESAILQPKYDTQAKLFMPICSRN